MNTYLLSGQTIRMLWQFAERDKLLVSVVGSEGHVAHRSGEKVR